MSQTIAPPGRQPLRLGTVTVPDRIEVEINQRTLLGWKSQENRFPQHVAGQLDDARYEYIKARIPLYDSDEPPPDLIEAVGNLLEAMSSDAPPSSDDLVPLIEELKQSHDWATAPRYRVASSDWRWYVTRCLQIVIPGLSQEEADNLSDEVRYGVLVDLGVFKPKEEQAEAVTQEAGAEPHSPPAPRPSSTGGKRGRASRGSST